MRDLELTIDLYVAHHNIGPKPFIWTASAKDTPKWRDFAVGRETT